MENSSPLRSPRKLVPENGMSSPITSQCYTTISLAEGYESCEDAAVSLTSSRQGSLLLENNHEATPIRTSANIGAYFDNGNNQQKDRIEQ